MSSALLTTYQGDFIWPYVSSTLLTPVPPPNLSDSSMSGRLITKDLCDCSAHDWSPHFQRARELLAEETAYREAMVKVSAERTMLENEIIAHPCMNSDDIIDSLYRREYVRPDFSQPDYRELKVDISDPTKNPMPTILPPEKSFYRDTRNFKTCALEHVPMEYDKARMDFPPPTTEYRYNFRKTADSLMELLHKSQELKPNACK